MLQMAKIQRKCPRSAKYPPHANAAPFFSWPPPSHNLCLCLCLSVSLSLSTSFHLFLLALHNTFLLPRIIFLTSLLLIHSLFTSHTLELINLPYIHTHTQTQVPSFSPSSFPLCPMISDPVCQSLHCSYKAIKTHTHKHIHANPHTNH